ncbi:TPA: flagellar biosynthetic protein FliQ, partial [Burkholderia vietnamiensis]|nr:flagellar biosynthetic protein FliQ [Burkholderia vietnamiensis]
MSSDNALGLMAQLMWTGLLVAGPMLLAALVTGLVISV